jgi:hypothetical protein
VLIGQNIPVAVCTHHIEHFLFLFFKKKTILEPPFPLNCKQIGVAFKQVAT